MQTYTKQFVNGYIAALEDVHRVYPAKDEIAKEITKFRTALNEAPHSSSFVRMVTEGEECRG